MFGFKKKKSDEQPKSVDSILGSIKDIIDSKESLKSKDDEVFDLTNIYQDSTKQDLIKNLNEKNIVEKDSTQIIVEKPPILNSNPMQDTQSMPSLKKSVLDEIDDILDLNAKKEIATNAAKPKEEIKTAPQEKVEVKTIKQEVPAINLANKEDEKLWETPSLKQENSSTTPNQVPAENYETPTKPIIQPNVEVPTNTTSFSEIKFEEIKASSPEEKPLKEDTKDAPEVISDNEKLDDSFKMILKEGAAKEIENEIKENIERENQLENFQTNSPENSPFQAIQRLNDHIESVKEEKRKGSQTIEDLVKESIRPLITRWLDENLARIVEVAVEKEIKKLVDERKW